MFQLITVFDRTPEVEAAVGLNMAQVTRAAAFGCEAAAKRNIQANGTIETGAMLNSVYAMTASETQYDNAAGEVCPIWPGQPMSAHWGLPDPAEATGSDAEIALAFADTYRMLRNRISAFAELPFASLDRLSLKRRLDEFGKGAQAANDTVAR